MASISGQLYLLSTLQKSGRYRQPRPASLSTQSFLSHSVVADATQCGERQKVGGQAALCSGSCVCGCDLNFGYQRRNRSSKSSLSTFVLVCSKRWAPRSVHCICCFLTNRLLTTWLIVDSTNAVLIISPRRQRSPKFGMRLLPSSWLGRRKKRVATQRE